MLHNKKHVNRKSCLFGPQQISNGKIVFREDDTIVNKSAPKKGKA